MTKSRAEEMVPLLGSGRTPLGGAKASGEIEPTERLRVTVVLRPNPARRRADLVGMSKKKPGDRRYLNRKDFAASRGASRADLASVRTFAVKFGIEVEHTDASRRTVILSGSAAQFNRAFGIRLTRYVHPKGSYRGHEGSVRVPRNLAGTVQAVLGLDDRPQAETRIRISPVRRRTAGDPYPGTFSPPQVASLYSFPAGLDGTGQCVAIIELGGGYATSDLQTFFNDVGVSMPSVASVSVDGAENSPENDPSNPSDPDGEVMLDIEVVGSVAPKARIVVYFAPNTDAGFFDAITTAIHDAENNPSVLSISWGQAESEWTAQAMQAMDGAFQDAASLGVTVLVAAGDNGSSDGVNDGLAHVDFPASAPYATGCGGTKLKGTGKSITSEVVWNELPKLGATGGGVSGTFPLPSWQAKAEVPPSVNPGGARGRGVPDVSGDADPLTGYYPICFDGTEQPIGGTSAVAPLWAGLVALLNQGLANSVGYLNPLIYAGIGASAAFHDIVSGDNPDYSAGKGWDACTGWGTPDGSNLLAALKG